MNILINFFPFINNNILYLKNHKLYFLKITNIFKKNYYYEKFNFIIPLKTIIKY